MSPIMEFVVIVIYVTVGLAVPLQKDYAVGRSDDRWSEDGIRLNPSTHYGEPRSVSPQKMGPPEVYPASSMYAPRPDYTYRQ